ncbi:hypothetical protein [Neptunomonas japonica]|uniref:hypothetical protein n=1 Tax=Neptunomonas japonica TaxID=417574 RepID=UPI000403D587|nr:hypothetical protein [Neptunomonas japonica]
MTLLSLLVDGYKTLQKRLDAQYTYQSMEHLDERLLIDVGVCRKGNTIVALRKEEIAASSDKKQVQNTSIEQTGCAEHAGQCCLLQDSGG